MRHRQSAAFLLAVGLAGHAMRGRAAEYRRGAAHGAVHSLRRREDAGRALQFPLPGLRAADAKSADGSRDAARVDRARAAQ